MPIIQLVSSSVSLSCIADEHETQRRRHTTNRRWVNVVFFCGGIQIINVPEERECRASPTAPQRRRKKSPLLHLPPPSTSAPPQNAKSLFFHKPWRKVKAGGCRRTLTSRDRPWSVPRDTSRTTSWAATNRNLIHIQNCKEWNYNTDWLLETGKKYINIR